MGRSSTRHKREIYCVDSAGEFPWQHGEIGNDCPGGGGVRPGTGVIVGPNDGTIVLDFTGCLQLVEPSPYGLTVESSADDGATWNPHTITGVTRVGDDKTTLTIVVTPTFKAGDDVRVSYDGTSEQIVDCQDPAEPIDGFDNFPIDNGLVLQGGQVLLETGGTSIVLVEDDDDDSAAVLVEDQEP